MTVEAIVADIDDDGLLGVDVLQNSKDGSIDILLSRGVLVSDKKEVPIIQVELSKNPCEKSHCGRPFCHTCPKRMRN